MNKEKEKLIEALGALRQYACAYGGSIPCDCKYGCTVNTVCKSDERGNGCPELLKVISFLLLMSDEQFKELDKNSKEKYATEEESKIFKKYTKSTKETRESIYKRKYG